MSRTWNSLATNRLYWTPLGLMTLAEWRLMGLLMTIVTVIVVLAIMAMFSGVKKGMPVIKVGLRTAFKEFTPESYEELQQWYAAERAKYYVPPQKLGLAFTTFIVLAYPAVITAGILLAGK